jgi:periplasmic divalent cation tolerance protein
MDQPRIVYTTFPDEENARAVARALVEDNLAACVNLIPGMRSVYRWQGKVEEAGEIVGIIKTRAQLLGAVEARIKELHPYDTPTIIHLEVAGAERETLAWLMEQTRAD